MRPPKDRDFLKTREGILFCVVGYLHPKDRVTAYLKYVPKKYGKWKDGDVFYSRELPFYHVKNVLQTVEFLEKEYPYYVSFCKVRNIKISMVPKKYILEYYVPEERIGEIFEGERDSLEEEVFEFVTKLQELSGVKLKYFGVTGSILTKIHNKAFSDIDLLIYGRKNALKIKEILGEVSENKKDLRKWAIKRSKNFGLTLKEALYFAERRWNYGYFNNRYFSIHPVRLDSEIREKYGDFIYERVGVSKIEAKVVDNSESLFLPSVYKISKVEVLEGKDFGISEVVSFEGLYSDAFDVGQKILVKGKVEKFDSRFRIVVGSFGLEEQYIKPIL